MGTRYSRLLVAFVVACCVVSCVFCCVFSKEQKEKMIGPVEYPYLIGKCVLAET